MSKEEFSTSNEQNKQPAVNKTELTQEQIAYLKKVKDDGARFSIDQHTIFFLMKNPFWAELSRRIVKIPTRKISTAGVSWHEKYDNLVLYYNPEFLAQLSDQHVISILIHEFMHIVYGHLNARRHKPHKLWNIATDAAINSIIYSNAKVDFNCTDSTKTPLPLFTIMPGRIPYTRDPLSGIEHPLSQEEIEQDPYIKTIMNMKPMLTSDHYFAALEAVRHEQQKNKCPTCGGYGIIKNPNKNKSESSSDDQQENDSNNDNGQGNQNKGDEKEDNQHNEDGKHQDDYVDCPDCGGSGGEIKTSFDSFDDHDMWDDIPEDMREYINNRIRNMIEKAVSKADSQSNGWGDIPAEIAAEIRQSVSRKVPWRTVLRQFIGTLIVGNRQSSIKKINKRFPYIHPGLKRSRKAKLLVAIDQSGSVDDHMLIQFFGELTSLTKDVEIDVLPFDCSASESEIYTWKKGGQCPKGRTRCGGTDFNAPTNIVNDPKNRGRWDGLLICTDGECGAPNPSRIKRGWVIGAGQKLMFQSNELQVFVDNTKPITGAWK